MKHFRAVLLPTVALVLALAAGTALAAKPKPKTVIFKGTYAGQVTEKVDGQSVTATTKATGTSTIVGKGKLTGLVTGTTSNPPCSPLAGTGALVGAKGTLKVALKPTSRGCAASAEDQDNVSVTGDAKVLSGTLKLKKATGTMHFSGSYDRKAGTFNVKFTGKLTYYP